MEKKELEAMAMAYTDPPQYFLTPPHERDILNEMAFSSNRYSYMAPPTVNSPPLRLLSLDGGGVKGYSSLLLLQEVMYRLFVELNGRPPQMHEIPLPCDHFDMIAGVGTGGLIALMLGRLRMDVESCKEQWVKMAKRVFETDKTIAGIPFKTTFFKASKLETVIKEITKEYTAGEDDEAKRQKKKVLQHKKNFSLDSKDTSGRMRASSSSSGETAYSRRSNELRMLAGDDDSVLQEKGMRFEYLTKLKSSSEGALVGQKVGNAETLLYDPREDRCKTFVAAMYQNSPEGASPCLLRTYLSLSSLNPEPNCKIWEAGRATSATMTAFKPIQIGQTVFLDEGAGRYNITPTIIEEATCNEWPGRAIGCVLSVGTGRPPPKKQGGSQPWWENKIHTPFDNFVDAKKRLVHKTHLSEEIHQMLLGGGSNSLDKWGVQRDDYFRLNVDMGVTDFAMNEWQRLSDISTNTKRWLNSPEGKKVIGDCAIKLAHIWRAKNIPPPKNPLRQQVPLMTEIPVEPLVTRSRPVSTTDIPPRPPSRMRPRTQAHERQLSGTPTSTPPATISRARTIQVPVRHNSQNLHDYSYHNPHHHHQKSLSSSSTYRDSYYTSEDEADEIRPRPLSVRQRSFTTSSASNSSSSIVIEGGVMGIGGKDKRHSVLSTMPIMPVPPIPRRAMTEGRINISPNLTPIPNPNPPSPDD
ncbi:hypothetical protein TWF281_007999 [Arthrobotrys megalospora]